MHTGLSTTVTTASGGSRNFEKRGCGISDVARSKRLGGKVEGLWRTEVPQRGTGMEPRSQKA